MAFPFELLPQPNATAATIAVAVRRPEGGSRRVTRYQCCMGTGDVHFEEAMNVYRAIQLECPGCGHMMEATSAARQSVHTCPRCSGMWSDVPFQDPSRLTAVPRVVNEESPISEGRESCPRCDEPLAFHAIIGLPVFVHWCARCRGTFFPRRAVEELARLDDGWLPERTGE